MGTALIPYSHLVAVAFQPGIDEHAGHAEFVRYFGQMVVAEEGCGGELFILQAEGATGIVGGEAYHLATGIGPWLVAEVTDVRHLEVGLFPDFTTHTLFKGLARLEKTGDKAVEGATEILGTHEQHFIAPRDAHDDGCGNGRPHFAFARRAHLAYAGVPTHGCPADGAEAHGGIEMHQLACLACHEVVREGKHIVGGTEADEGGFFFRSCFFRS